MNNILTFNIGDETRPKVEDLFATSEQSFFYEVYEKALNLIAEILEQNKMNRNNERDNLLFQERNNTIAFVGDRGTGKTSCMKTVYHTLKFKSVINDIRLEELHQRIKHFSIITLPIIDPSYFEERHKILDIVIAHMFETFQEYIRHNGNIPSFEQYATRENRQDLIQRFQKVKVCLDTIKKAPSMSYDTIENLSEMANGIDLKDSIQKLIDSYLKFFGGNALAIAIDDLDLQIKYAYDMVEYLRKYLILRNVIILIGVKLSQLNDLMKQYYYQENMDLISTNRLTDTTENMAGRYLSKLIPFNQRVFIPNVGNHFDKTLKIYFKNELVIEGSINTLVLNLIFIKTRYLFYHTDNNSSLIIPKNLRDLLNLISLLYHMEDISSGHTEKDKLNTQKNRLRFRNYFIDTWCCENLSAEMYAFIKELETLEASNINKRVIDFLMQLITTETRTQLEKFQSNHNPDIRFESDIIYTGNRSYNVSLGDVEYVLDKLSNNYRIPYVTKFVFALKTIYSFFLYRLFEEQKDDVEARENHLQMQYYQVEDPNDSLKHIRKMTKLMIVPSYERLLGGNLIRIANLSYIIKDDNKPYSTEREANTTERSSFIHQKKINSELLNELNQYIFDKTDDNTTKLFHDVPREQALNIWEFFVLTTYLNEPNRYFRSQKRCYYLPSPGNFPIDFKTAIIYSSTAILFNIVKFYDFFKLYYQKGLRKDLKENSYSKQWDSFWNVISSEEYSLLHKLLYCKNGFNYEKTGFSNYELERVFIRNMEVLDTLEDYLPYLKKRMKNPDSQTFKYETLVKPYTDFYRQLARFQFQLYPKEIEQYKNNSYFHESISFEIFDVIPDFLETLKDEGNTPARRLFIQIMYPDS